MTEPMPVLVPAELLGLARNAERSDFDFHPYALRPNGWTARLMRRARVRTIREHFEHRWQFSSSSPLESIRAMWLSPHAQFTAGEAEELLKRLPHLATVYWQRTGLDGLPSEAFLARGVRITTGHGLTTRWVAEAILACILADAKLLCHSARAQMPPRSHFTRALGSLHIAVLGTGAIGCETASVCRALGMRVIGLSRTSEVPTKLPAAFDEIRSARDDLRRTAAEADYLVLALPLTAQSVGIVGQEVLQALGPRGVLVNLARPGLVDQRAMLRALNDRTLGAAYVSRLDDTVPWASLRSRGTRHLVLTHNREANMQEKPAHALRHFLAMLDVERLRLPPIR